MRVGRFAQTRPAGRCGRALLTGNCLTVVLLVLHRLPRHTPPSPRCPPRGCFHPVVVVLLCSEELPHQLFPYTSEHSTDYRTKTHQPSSHDVRGGSCRFPVGKSHCVSVRWMEFLVRSWKRVISSPSLARSSPARWGELLVTPGPRQTLH